LVIFTGYLINLRVWWKSPKVCDKL
jgi:hypothetical protein